MQTSFSSSLSGLKKICSHHTPQTPCTPSWAQCKRIRDVLLGLVVSVAGCVVGCVADCVVGCVAGCVADLPFLAHCTSHFSRLLTHKRSHSLYDAYLDMISSVNVSGGGRGIRTLDTTSRPYNGFRDRRLQPLGHPSHKKFLSPLKNSKALKP